jgi:hypothetical protein
MLALQYTIAIRCAALYMYFKFFIIFIILKYKQISSTKFSDELIIPW